MDAAPQDLLDEISDRYGLAGPATPIAAGVSGSSLWRLDAAPPVLVRVARHYELGEVRRCCEVAERLSRSVPEVLAPLRGRQGELAFLWDDRAVSVWPFVEGSELDRDDPELITQAGRLLARLHCAGATVPGPDGRTIPGAPNAAAAAELLPDPRLDAWLRSWRAAGSVADSHGWMHGDFFWRNILCDRGRIVALVDWEEVWCGPLVVELASSLWEFAKTPTEDAMVPERASRFLASYRDAGGPATPSADLIPIIRERLRRGIAFFRSVVAYGHVIDPADEKAKFDAFESLARLDPATIVG